MKISFMTFACPNWPLEQVIAAAQQHEYHGVEFRIDAQHEHNVEVWTSKEERQQIRKTLEQANLEIPCLATSIQLVQEDIAESAIKRIELAADLGAHALRVFGGQPPQSWSMAAAIDRVAANLRTLTDAASHHDVDLWLETHDAFSLAQDAAAAIRKADHERLGLNYDNMHPYRMGEPLDATFAHMGSLVRHCHLHDALNLPDVVDIKPMLEGQMPIDEMFQKLLATGYDRYISGEWFNTQYGPDPDASLERFRHDVADLCQRHGVLLG